MPEHWTGEILAGIAAIILATVVAWRALMKTLIDLLKEVRDLRKENSDLRKQNNDLHRKLVRLVEIIRADRAKWSEEKAQMQAQINKLTAYLNRLVPHLKVISKQNHDQAEKIETLLALNAHYQKELSKRPVNGTGD